MDCKYARLLLDFACPASTELEASEAAALQRHLTDCPDCRAQARAERALDEHFGQAMRAVPIPEGLRTRLMTRLDAHRDAWWRRKILRVGALAATLVLAAWLGWRWWTSFRADVDLERVRETASATFATPQEVEKWFLKEYGVAMIPPPDLDYKFLVSCNLVRFEGKQVPMLLFFYRGGGKNPQPAVAQVYVLSDRQFNLDKLAGGAISGIGRQRVVTGQYTRDGRQFAYVALIDGIGADLDLFKPPASGA